MTTSMIGGGYEVYVIYALVHLAPIALCYSVMKLSDPASGKGAAIDIPNKGVAAVVSETQEGNSGFVCS